MTTLEEFDFLLKDCLCVWTLLREMGIPGAYIYFAWNDAYNSIEMAFKWHGELAHIRIGQPEYNRETATRQWTKLATAWSSGEIPDQALRNYMEKSDFLARAKIAFQAGQENAVQLDKSLN